MKIRIFLSFFLLALSFVAYAEERLIGLYLNDKYLQELEKTKNHYSAMNYSGMKGPQAINIYTKDNKLYLLELWNFHEGVTINIEDSTNQLVKTKDHDYSFNKKLYNNKFNESYIKISNNTDESNYQKYIISKLFPLDQYESSVGVMHKGNKFLIINKDKYDLELDVAGYINKLGLNIFENNNIGKYYAFDVKNQEFQEVRFNDLVLVPKNQDTFSYNKKTLDLNGYKIDSTNFLIDNNHIKLGYILKENRKNETTDKEIDISAITGLILFSAETEKLYIKIDKDIVYAGNNRIIDISGPDYKYLDFYGWDVSIYHYPSLKDVEPIVRIDPITHGGKGITDGFTINYNSAYKQFVFERFPSGGIPGIVTDLDEPKYMQIARSGIPDVLVEEFGVSTLKRYINSLSRNDLRLFRNCLFALHGYKFHSEDLTNYFSKFDWYNPNPDIPNNKNILIKEQQRLFDLILEAE